MRKRGFDTTKPMAIEDYEKFTRRFLKFRKPYFLIKKTLEKEGYITKVKKDSFYLTEKGAAAFCFFDTVADAFDNIPKQPDLRGYS